MEISTMLIANGFFLAIVLFIFLLLSENTPQSHNKRQKTREDIKRIKEQINDTKD